MSGYRPRRPSSKRSSDVTRSSAPPDPDRLTPVWVFLFKAGRRLRLGPGGKVWTALGRRGKCGKAFAHAYNPHEELLPLKRALGRGGKWFQPLPPAVPSGPPAVPVGAPNTYTPIHIIYIYI